MKTARLKTPSGVPSPSDSVAEASVERVDTSYLESLMGYNARRAALSIIELFMERMSVYDLRPVNFSVLVLITHNPGITSRQLCSVLGVLPKRSLIERRPHPSDGRAMGLHLTAPGHRLMRDAEKTAAALELEATSRLSASERKTLMRLLQKVYL